MSKASGWRWSAGALVLALSVLTLSTQAEPPAKKKDPGAMAASFSSLKIKEEAKYRDVVNVARDAITSKDWDRAIQALQILLDLKTDHYVQVRDLDPAGHEVLRWTSVKFEANKLLGGLPGEALDAYEIAHGAKAKAMLDDAKKTGNREEMAEVAQRYYHTRAGADANDLLGTYFLDRGQYFVAALRFEKLMAMPEDRVKITDLTLLKAALAYRRAGDTKNSDLAWKKLVGRIGDRGMKLGDELVATADLRKALDTIPVVTSVNPNDWPMIRGNQTNTAQANGSPPLLDMLLWKRPLVLDKLTEFPDEEGKEAQDQLTRALKQMEDAKDRAILPGFFPIAANKILVYRSYSDIRAVYLEDQLDGAGKVTAKAGDIAWKVPAMDGGLAKIMAATGTDIKLPTIQNWLTRYSSVVGYGSLVYENSLLGTLSTDHKYVYAIDDLAVPIPPDQFQPFIWASANVPANIKPLVMSNKLYAIDLVHGDMKWELGTKEDGFSDSHFLGVPISVGGKLYVLNEKNGGVGTPTGNSELRLICIDPSKVTGRTPQIIEPIQSLGEIEQNSRVTHYPGRRLTSAQLAYGEGVLVCPTHAGEVLGVDLASRSLAWAYPYREQAPPPLPFAPATPFPMPGIPMIPVLPTTNTQTGFFSWYPAPPAIAEGKVIFTAPDANSVHCINLRDGTPVWKKRQADGDLYMGGVYNGKVLIVNKNRVTALNLHDGRAMWTVATSDFPSGQGVASNNVYYLPLKKGEILAIDIDKGVVKAHNRARSTPTTPGNLVFYEGTVISQTPTEIMAFPQLVARLAQANIALKADPTNPVKLVDRGELFLADGQVQSAVNDLEKAIELKPAADVTKRAQTRLYEALTELLQIDFKGTNVRYLKEYDQLCKLGDTPQEQQLREAKFYRIVGQGRETLGELIDAYDNYKRFGALPIHKETGGVAGLDDPSHKVPIDIWLRARIGDMMAKATPEQREPLNRKIADEWKIVEAKKDVGEIRYFVSMFDVPFNVGRDARLRLAESIIAKGDKGAFLEAEMRLEELRISKFRKDVDGGRALATLALLEEKKGSTESLKLAAAYYRELARDFADVPVRDKITGAALFNDMATDKRFLPYLGERIVSWGDAKVAAKELPRGSTEGVGGFSFLPTGDLTPRMKSLRLVMDPSDINNIGFKLVDVGSHTTIWSKTLGTLNNPVNQKYFQFLYQPNPNPEAKFRYFHAKGHVFAVQVGSIALCLNADTGDVLWQKTLSEVSITPGTPGLLMSEITADEDGYLAAVIWNQFNNQKTRVPLGQVGAIDAGYVALVTQKGLEVVDPLKGTLLWKKMDVTTHTRVFGDENHLFLIENADAESAGTGRVLSARDGSSIDAAPDFGGLYANKIRVEGRTMLVAVPQKGGLILKRYDIPTGKDLWSKNFGVKTYPLHTYQAGITGAVDVDGNAYILNAETGEELVKTNVIKSQILADDLRGLERPILLADADRYYIALNRPVDGNKISGSVIGNNFNNGMSCAQVNGWVLALKRGEGEEKIGGAVRKRTNGDFLWHTFKPLANQMVLVEQFEEMPVLIFTSRYNEMLNMGVGGNRWLSPTQSVDKRTGKMIWDPGPRPSNGSPQYLTFTFDPSSGTITMATLGSTLVHYIDDGRKIVVPGGDATASGPGASGTGVGPMLPPPGFVPMGPGAVIRPPVIRMPPIRRPLPVAPLPDLPKK